MEDIGARFDGAPHLGDTPRENVAGRRDWWTGWRP